MKPFHAIPAALVALALTACSGIDPLYSAMPVDSQGEAATALPAGARLLIRSELAPAPAPISLSGYASLNAPADNPLTTMVLEDRGGVYFSQALTGARRSEVAQMLENGMRTIRASANPDAYLLQFNNIGDAGRQAFSDASIAVTAQAVSLVPALRRCTASMCAMWLFGKSVLTGAADDDSYGLVQTSSGDYVATSAPGVGRLWARALAANAFDPRSSTYVIVYRQPGAAAAPAN